MSTDDAPDSARPAGPRARARERTMRRIIELGNEQLREHGPEGLSLREVARGLGMVSSAVYRYVASRDELLTLLLVDAYTDLADTVDAALEAAAADAAPAVRFTVLAQALRTWALAQPTRWSLLYGTPVRGYAAPAETTTGPGTRVMTRLVEIAAAAGRSSALVPPLEDGLDACLVAAADEIGIDATGPVTLRATVVWSAVVGAVTGEITRQYGPTFDGFTQEVFDAQIAVLAAVLDPA
ncbi:MAG TPA: TetR/AcrR family transcriptional regulator [Candidatus Brachybacterium merdigallinarum]|nr:TetR/AcrR family transcriptional regulator [Candidatus Brachybacterium merdigallinarum]